MDSNDGLVQERRNSGVLAIELRHSLINPWKTCLWNRDDSMKIGLPYMDKCHYKLLKHKNKYMFYFCMVEIRKYLHNVICWYTLWLPYVPDVTSITHLHMK